MIKADKLKGIVMSAEFDRVVDNIKQPSVWIRVLFMVGFAVLLYLIMLPVIVVLTVAQALFVIITGEVNANLKYFGAAIEQYVSQILKFLTYNSEIRPFPFSDFPNVEEDEEGAEIVEKSTAEADSSAKKKAPEKKAAAAKTASRKSTKKAPTKKASSKNTATKKASAKKSTVRKNQGKNAKGDESS